MFFDLTDKAHEEIDYLSGGMKRRLAIARAFMTSPRVIVLDEPTTGLDPQGRNRVWQELETMKQGGVTILMSTHYMDEAAALCDRLAIMHHGKISRRRHARRTGHPARGLGSGAGARIQWRAPGRGGLDRQCRPRLSGRRRGHYRYLPQRRATGPVGFGRGCGSPTGRSNLEDVFLTMAGRGLTDDE